MAKKNYNGIWFYGNSGSGKTLASTYLKKKVKYSIVVDGDEVRKFISFDLGYSLSERKIQITRVLGLAKIAIRSDIFPILSTVFMTADIMKKAIKEKILLVKILRDLEKINDFKKIYKNNSKNIIGKDIQIPKLNSEFKIDNNSSKNEFKKKILKLI